MDMFGVSVGQVSTDFRPYIGFASENIFYNKRARKYVDGLDFNVEFFEPDANRCQAQLHSITDIAYDGVDAWFGNCHPMRSHRGPREGLMRRCCGLDCYLSHRVRRFPLT